MNGTRRQNPLLAWHASPYDFDKFGEMRKVSGSGQGAAMYGRGVAYVAENPKISGPGESEYMKEFAYHPSVKSSHRWQFKHTHGGPDWEDLTTDAFDEYAKPDALYQDRHDFGRSWVLSHLSNHDMQQDPEALNKLRELVRSEHDHRKANPKSKEPIYGDLTHFMDQRLWWVPDDAKEEHYNENHAREVADYLEHYADQELRHVKDTERQGPFSYKVAVHLRPETMLDWDAGFEDHHPEAQEKIAKAFGHSLNALGPGHDETKKAYHQSIMNNMKSLEGKNIYSSLAQDLKSDYGASEALYDAGIHGIRYKDQGSRNQKPIVKFDGKELDPTTAGKDDMLLPTLVATWFTNAAPGDDFDKLKKFFNSARPPKLFGDKSYARTYESIQKSKNFLEANEHRFEIIQPKPTYNYVVFHPDFVEALTQYNIKGEKIRDIGPGVHLKAVDHDPFKGEDK